MRRHLAWALVSAGFLACGGGAGGGGGSGNGSGAAAYTLSGRVTTIAPTLAAIPNATVAITDGPNVARSATTDGNGAYTLTGLQPGGFSVTASAVGYDSSSQGVTLAGNQTLDFQLVEAPLPMSERVAAHRFPRLGSQLQGYLPDESLLLGLADRDLLIVDAELVANERASALGPRGALRRRNRNLVVLTYFSSADVLPGNTSPINGSFITALQDGWYMKDTAGRRVKLFDLGGGNWSEMLNLTTSVNDFMARHLQDTCKTVSWRRA